jgi:drug/metabolite transporter (DMT)-like permease
LLLAVGALLIFRYARKVTPAMPGWSNFVGLWPIVVAAGIFDVGANIAVIYGLRLGDLSVVSVLVALYPAGTILLASVVLRERIALVQWFGLGLALVASALLAA